MTDSEIIEYVQKELANPKNQTIDFDSDDALIKYKVRTANRLIKNISAFADGSVSELDFGITLRDFMLVFKTSLTMKTFSFSKEMKRLGFFINATDGEVWVNYSVPPYANAIFWNKAYMQGISKKEDSRDLALSTNIFIKNLTGFEFFKSEEQKLIVMGALNTPCGYTSLISMSTGGGKSLATQCISYQEAKGLTIVVVPTVSLMMDQFANANAIINHDTKEEIFLYHSGVNLQPFLNALSEEKARMLFVSPESLLKNKALINALDTANEKNQYIRNIVIDEAHVICEWGDSFRVDFQCIEAVRNKWMKDNKDIRTFLLSATFCKQAVQQLKQAYSTDERWIEIRCDKLREEILFDVIKCSSYSEKMQRTLEMIELLPHPIIIYVRSPSDADDLKTRLLSSGHNNIEIFTGNTSNNERERIISDWKSNKFSIMIATCAFGVGVDKPDVRTVLHIYIPENANKYYQEAGRGGRDGLPSLSCILYTDKDVEDANNFVTKVLTPEKLIGRWFSMLNSIKTERKTDGVIVLDTSVKPNYADDETTLVQANSADVNWNVYVILLLHRAGLLSILNVEFNDRYIFTIKLINAAVGFCSEESNQILTEVRENEWAYNCEAFNLIEKSLENVGKQCWSEMFNEVYKSTVAYCAGCNFHSNKYSNVSQIFPIKNGQQLKINENNIRLLGSSKIGIGFFDNIEDSIAKLVGLGITIFVGFEGIRQASNNPKAVQWSYKEFYELISAAPYYLNGCIAILCPRKKDELALLISKLTSPNQLNWVQVFLISDEDTYLYGKNKKISELINGPCFQPYFWEVNDV